MNLKIRSACLLSAIVLSMNVYSQITPRKIKASRTDMSIKIDGVLDDDAWKGADSGTGFTELRPTPGAKEKTGQGTEFKIMYDDMAVYVYARMNDLSSDSIAKQIVPRDQVGNADFIAVTFDTYLDKINGVVFLVTAAGSQYDAKISQTNNEDSNWNAVWFSAAKVDDKGWSAEMKIPYSALRFSSKDVQTWGLNLNRTRAKFNQQLFWNNIDPKVNGFLNQFGELTNIENIRAPVRLSFSPYISNNTSHYPHNKAGLNNLTSKMNGGMDVKYGINDAFTLDMTLVPDFGQVQSDNRILNLTPFDVRFNERRQFFTEGTEMFSKGDLFYPRKIGIEPAYSSVRGGLDSAERVTSSPNGSKLLNATKISGRTSKGLGIGVFNAVTNNMFSKIKNDSTGIERTAESQPLTNYSIVVFDQSLKNNSSLTFLNTNVLRKGKPYDANVSALLFRLNNNKNSYFIAGEAKVSHLTPSGTNKSQSGINYEFGFGKQSGNFNWEYGQELSDNKYNQRDLGFFTNNNFLAHELEFSYNLFKPSKWYNRVFSEVEFSYTERLIKRSYQSMGISTALDIQLKNFWWLSLYTNVNAVGNNFYEARSNDQKVFKEPASRSIRADINSNGAKKFRFGTFMAVEDRSLFDAWGWSWGSYQNYRMTDRFSVGTEFTLEPRFDFAGWSAHYTDKTNFKHTIFSKYDRQTVEGIFSMSYTFSTRMGLTLRARHYWSERENKQYYSLNSNGLLTEYADFKENKNQNYNAFNIDMNYTWQFAPGSEILIAYKNEAGGFSDILQKSYGRNLSTTLNSPQNNSLSVKVLYFIDYLDLRKKFKKRVI